MKRDDVEKLLACTDSYRGGPFAPVSPDELRALCERWLAVEDAPVSMAIAHASQHGDWLEVDGLSHDDLDALDCQSVRIIPDIGKEGGDHG